MASVKSPYLFTLAFAGYSIDQLAWSFDPFVPEFGMGRGTSKNRE